MQKSETLANGYSSESTQRELSNEYQHDRVWMVYKNLCICVLWTSKVASALEGLRDGMVCGQVSLILYMYNWYLYRYLIFAIFTKPDQVNLNKLVVANSPKVVFCACLRARFSAM